MEPAGERHADLPQLTVALIERLSQILDLVSQDWCLFDDVFRGNEHFVSLPMSKTPTFNSHLMRALKRGVFDIYGVSQVPNLNQAQVGSQIAQLLAGWAEFRKTLRPGTTWVLLDSVLASAIATILYVALRAGHEGAAQWLAPLCRIRTYPDSAAALISAVLLLKPDQIDQG